MSSILTEIKDQIGYIWIDRPEVHNALDQEVWRELRDAFCAMDEDDDVHVIIVSGKGDKAFVAGSDVKYLRRRTVKQTLDRETPRILTQIAALRKPTIAAINGYAFGGGCELALACDIRIASERAKMGQTEVNLGIIPGAGGTQRLCRAVGLAKGLELVMTGGTVDAYEAERIGLVNRVVPHEHLMEAAVEMADRIKRQSPIIVRLAKASCKDGYGTDMDTAILIEGLYQTLAFGTKDHFEGIDAFLEKRAPEFSGD